MKYLSNLWVSLVLLKQLIGIDVRVLIIKSHNEANMDQIWLHVIQE